MDWYRKKSWTKSDEEHFYSKLNRAREYNRSQYLRIQATELIATNKPKLIEVAESLLIKILTEYPEDDIFRGVVLMELGEIYEKRNKLDRAIEFFKAAIDFEKKYPNVKTDSYLKYSELIIKTNRIKQFDFAKKIILEEFETLIFPSHKYKAALILSIIYQQNKESKLAKKYADIAEKNANKETSDMRYHKNLGVVTKRSWLEKLIKSD